MRRPIPAPTGTFDYPRDDLMNARNRLSISLAIGIVAFILAFIFTEWQVAILVGWDATAAAFIAIVYFSTLRQGCGRVPQGRDQRGRLSNRR